MFTCCRIHNSGLKLWNYNWHRRISVEERAFAAKRKECSQCAAGKYSIAKHFTNAQSLPQNGNQEIFPPRGRFCFFFFFFSFVSTVIRIPGEDKARCGHLQGHGQELKQDDSDEEPKGCSSATGKSTCSISGGGREQHGRSRICPDNWDAAARGAC